MSGLLTAHQVAQRYGVKVQSIHCGTRCWLRRGLPVAEIVKPRRGGKLSRLFDPDAVAAWHAVHVAAALDQRKPPSARATRNGRLLLSAGAVRLLSGRRDLPRGGGVMLFAASLTEEAVLVAFVEASPRAALFAVHDPGAVWNGTLAPTVVATSTYLRPPVAARRQCRAFDVVGGLRVEEVSAAGGIPVLRLSRGEDKAVGS